MYCGPKSLRELKTIIFVSSTKVLQWFSIQAYIIKAYLEHCFSSQFLRLGFAAFVIGCNLFSRNSPKRNSGNENAFQQYLCIVFSMCLWKEISSMFQKVSQCDLSIMCSFQSIELSILTPKYLVFKTVSSSVPYIFTHRSWLWYCKLLYFCLVETNIARVLPHSKHACFLLAIFLACGGRN